MAESRKYIRTQLLELDEILREAEHRWLRPAEICEILRNYQKFELTPDPPVKPPAGSLFLFDRKALRYFRKDGHRWRKKKDGKTVKEAHEKLKAGSVDVLHCYYAHGEDNDNFQRRSYWMLDEQLEHIVLVHYREIKEGYNKCGISRLPLDPVSLVGSPQNGSAPSTAQVNSPVSGVQTSYASSVNRVDWNGRALSSEYEDVDSGGDQQASSHNISSSRSHIGPLLTHEATGFAQNTRNPFIPWSCSLPDVYRGTGSSPWASVQNFGRNTVSIHNGDGGSIGNFKTDFIVHKLSDAKLDAGKAIQDAMTCGDRLFTHMLVQPLAGVSQTVNQAQKEHDLSSIRTEPHDHTDHPGAATSTVLVEQKFKDGGTDNGKSDYGEFGELKKLDSFGRWMDKEIGVDCDDSLMTSDSGNYWNTLDAHNEDKEVTNFRHMQLDMDSLGPSLSQEQLFSIHDFSPDWAYAGVETKVLIVGTFLGSKKLSAETKWGCMFGEIEVSAEVLTDNVIRCQTPLHSPGRVPFYVTCSNRLACSEVREFEYRENPIKCNGPLGIRITPEEEVHLQLRLLKLVNLGPDKKWFDCSVTECEKCTLKGKIYLMKDDGNIFQDTPYINESDVINPRDVLVQRLLRDKLYEWLVFKVHEEGKGPNLLDDQGQGVIHLTAALGYVWAMGPIVGAGVNPNFRDARGRTALHWASYFGSEETVIALVKLAASPGAVEDPTSAFPRGVTAADLASSRGHKGIAGYLAEADLTSHFSTLTVNKHALDNIVATIAVDSAFETAQSDSSNLTKDEHHLKESLAAYRKSARAAALIQASFRARSFRQRVLTRSSSDTSDATVDLVAAGCLNKIQNMGHFEDYLHSAALRIQRKYRGWKGRKEFLKIRNRIVKIQAHVRGHQVRKQYKKVVWSVGIVEKAILRWRRKGAGLRGFRVGHTVGTVAPDSEKSDEYEFLSIGRKQKSDDVDKALARVKSMVRNPEARDQYVRLVTKFQNFKIGDCGTD
ncbi:hypothetical protein L6164_013736 [Bauhinia variegata]|uniref:Uncharacterized protein n=1 Tax=Bauhinia variegata TaxID=167791 RepID=A0ACB9NFD7_BAUVA|nr:hypothetical protein L6164_013736 [Bauhinia variegata]